MSTRTIEDVAEGAANGVKGTAKEPVGLPAETDEHAAIVRLRKRVQDLELQGELFQSHVRNCRGILFYRSYGPGKIIAYGGNAQDMIGVIGPDGVVDVDAWHAAIHPDDLEDYQLCEKRRQEDGTSFTLEFRIRHPISGRTKWLREHAFRLSSDGEDERFFNVGHIIDITEEKETEYKLLEATDAAIAANRAKSEFLANMSHELRTPLNAIIGFAEFMMTDPPKQGQIERYQEYTHDIHASAMHLLQLIEDILDVAKAEAGRTALSEGRIDLAHLIHGTLRMIFGRADKKKLQITARVDHDLPLLYADERRIRQILLNLLSNSVKFTNDGDRITVIATARADGGIDIIVNDSGVGIAQEDQDRALQPFVQIHSGFNREYAGTGLGLPLSKKLIELHGGTMTLTSVPNVGTKVRVEMPAWRSTPRPVEDPDPLGLPPED